MVFILQNLIIFLSGKYDYLTFVQHINTSLSGTNFRGAKIQ